MVVELWCDALLLEAKVLVAWESVHWSPDLWVAVDVDVETTESDQGAASQPQITIDSETGHLSFVDSVLDVTVWVVVKGQTQELGESVLSIATVELELVLSLSGESKSPRGVGEEHLF